MEMVLFYVHKDTAGYRSLLAKHHPVVLSQHTAWPECLSSTHESL